MVNYFRDIPEDPFIHVQLCILSSLINQSNLLNTQISNKMQLLRYFHMTHCIKICPGVLTVTSPGW